MEIILFFILLMLIGTPIAFSMGIVSLCYFIIKEGFQSLIQLPTIVISGVDNFILIAIPLFILAGKIMNSGGITDRIFRFANSMVGHIAGGLGHVNVIASVIFSGMSGSSIADVAGLGAIEIKAMNDEGYDIEFSAGITAASATIGPIIPPSVPMIVYGFTMGVSIGELFIAGIIPGLLMGLSLMCLVYFIAKKRNYPIRHKASFTEFIHTFKEAFLSLLSPIILIGGIMTGIFTPTECAAVAVFYSFFLGFFVYKTIHFRDLGKICLEVIISSAKVLFILAVAFMFVRIITIERFPQLIENFLISANMGPSTFLLFVIIVLLIAGCFMQVTPNIILFSPIFSPLVIHYGIDPVHFGLIIVLGLMIGVITPPVGANLFVVSDIAGISFDRAVKGVIPFIIPLVIVLFIITYFPIIVLWLPNLIFK